MQDRPQFRQRNSTRQTVQAWLALVVTTVAVTSAGVIPPERRHDWNPGIPTGIPQVQLAANVMDFGAMADGVNDDGPAFNDAIASVTEAGYVYVPPGSYRIATVVSLKDNVVLQGAGPSKTRLFFDLPSFGFRGGIEMTGSLEATETPVLSGFELGSQSIELASVDGIDAGTTLWIFQNDDDDAMYTANYWRTDYSPHSMGQIVGVTSVDGLQVELDTALRMTYQPSLSPRVRVVRPIRNAGVEAMYLERLDEADAFTIHMEQAEDCWVRYVESRLTYRSHIWASFSRRLTISDNYFYEAHDYGEGGHGYGVTLADCTSDALVTNNIFHTLRHSMMAKEGANGNVYSYNYSFDNRSGGADGSMHGHYNYGNLWEGNVLRELVVSDWWGPSGPFTTLFRNRTQANAGISVRDHSDFTNVVGNTTNNIEIRKSFDIILFGYPVYMGEVDDELVDGNLVDGDLEWNGTPTELEDSYYLEGPPLSWGTAAWPGVGADVDQDGEDKIPAQRRYDLIQAGTWAPPLPPILDSFTLTAGLDATLQVQNATPGELVAFLSTRTGTGAGACFPGLAGLCVDLLDPLTQLGQAVADADGTATITIPVPLETLGDTFWVQSVVPRGPGNVESITSNIRSAPVNE